jgi:RND family efflux transporter MFP subunit
VRQAEANLESQQARLAELQSGSRPEEVRGAELARETAEQNLRNAEDQLLNTDLQAYVNDGGQAVRTGSLQPPLISGNYEHTETGEYRITLYKSDSKSGYSFRYNGLEQGAQTVSTDNPEPLGDRGLYIQFPENFAKNQLLEWVVPIPNTRSDKYTQARNNKRQAEIRLEEVRNSLQLTKSGSRPEAVDAQLAQVESAQANLQAAEAQLNKTIVTAPFAGSVQSVSVDPGGYIGTGQQVAKLINKNQLEITANVGTNIARQLSVGDMATIGEGDVQVRIVAIAPGVNNQTGNVTVKLAVEGDANNLRPGSYTDVSFSVREGSANLNKQTLPLSAVITTSDENYVFVVGENNKLRKQRVRLGEITGNRVTVLNSLPNNPIVANASTRDLSVGQRVIITRNGE